MMTMIMTMMIDINDAFPLDSSEWLDTDGDAIGNNADPDDDNDGIIDVDDEYQGCPWPDTDSDGVGNNADPDDDNDTYLDINDAFPLDSSEWLDTDGDAIGNNADPDDDNDIVMMLKFHGYDDVWNNRSTMIMTRI